MTVSQEQRDSVEFDYEAALEACARGERFGLQAIYARDSRWLYAVILNILRKPELAEEALQEAMLKIWKSAHTYSSQSGSARGWMYTVARNQALNVLRKAKSQPLELDLDGLEVVDERSVQSLSVEAEMLSECLAKLDETKRRSITLAFVNGFTHEQIAQKMETPLGSVKSWIRRGLIKLKECLS